MTCCVDCPMVNCTFIPVTPALSVKGPRCSVAKPSFLKSDQVLIGRHERTGVVNAGIVRDERAFRVLVDISDGDRYAGHDGSRRIGHATR